MDLIWLVLMVEALAMLIAGRSAQFIHKKPVGILQTVKTASYIQDGTKAFIKRQCRTITISVASVLISLALLFEDTRVLIIFIFGVFLSLLAANMVLPVVVEINVRYVHIGC